MFRLVRVTVTRLERGGLACRVTVQDFEVFVFRVTVFLGGGCGLGFGFKYQSISKTIVFIHSSISLVGTTAKESQDKKKQKD